jgi:superfamily II DNA or RNA helicase
VTLDDLIADGRTSLEASIKSKIDRAAFRRDIARLTRFVFWTESRKHPTLWNHQKAAIGTVVAYLSGDKSLPERPEHKEAALLKLPTGTGKSGIIAVVARCLPGVRKVLVLTPREVLTKQLLKDIRYRFWKHIGCAVKEGQLFTATADAFGNDLETVYTEMFLPSRSKHMVVHLEGADRAVLVGTHQALDMIRRIALDKDNPNSTVCGRLLQGIKDSFDLICVDEGHYEPAVSWSQGVRDFNLPTVLLSATPYRNDYKSFRVRGRYLFNYPYADAVKERIIRPVEIVVPERASAARGANAIEQFVQLLKFELPKRLRSTQRWFKDEGTLPKVMVRAQDLDTLETLQAAIDQAFKTKSVLIHDRAKRTSQNQDRFTSVSMAIHARPDAQFWIHQFKLMEGIDDPSFVAVAIFDLMGKRRVRAQVFVCACFATRCRNGPRCEQGVKVAVPR